MVSKSASQPAPVRNTTRARNSLGRRSVQSQVALWENVARDPHVRPGGEQAGHGLQGGQQGQYGQVVQQGQQDRPLQAAVGRGGSG